jgi:SAM-dependent methyltransferase
MEIKLLDLGCGANKTPGAIGMDVFPSPDVDIVHNINHYPWPLADNSFDEVRCSHIIEHAEDIVKTMEEIFRVLKPGGIVKINTPHFSSFNSWTDPTHRFHLAYRSMDFFSEGRRYQYTRIRFEVLTRKLVFGRGLICYFGRMIAALSPDIFEKYFCFIFPARDVVFELRAIK